MSSQLEKILRHFPSDYLTYTELCVQLPVSEDARYAQVKRALKEGILIRLRKGVYRLGNYLEKSKPHPFEMSHYMLWPSYVSLESALSYHGLIPEAVFSTTCVTIRRSWSNDNEFGHFSYRPLPLEYFFLGVSRVEEDNAIFFVASPWKSITDYVYCYKKKWSDMTPLIESLRLDLENLPPLDIEFSLQLSNYYQSKVIDRFLKGVIKYYHEY